MRQRLPASSGSAGASSPGPRWRSDAGFSLTEMLVAMVVIGGVLVGLLAFQVGVLRTSQTSRERVQATALANQAVERVRALEPAEVGMGLDSADLADDDDISGGVLRYGSLNESVITSPAESVAPLLRPHVRQATVDGLRYEVKTYVTEPSTVDSSGCWVTAVVSWTGRNGQDRSLSSRTFVFVPQTDS